MSFIECKIGQKKRTIKSWLSSSSGKRFLLFFFWKKFCNPKHQLKQKNRKMTANTKEKIAQRYIDIKRREKAKKVFTQHFYHIFLRKKKANVKEENKTKTFFIIKFSCLFRFLSCAALSKAAKNQRPSCLEIKLF